METRDEAFYSGIRDYLDNIAMLHEKSISALVEEGIIEALTLLALNIDDELLKKLMPEEMEAIAELKNARLKYSLSKNYLTIMISNHDKQIIKKQKTKK